MNKYQKDNLKSGKNNTLLSTKEYDNVSSSSSVISSVTTQVESTIVGGAVIGHMTGAYDINKEKIRENVENSKKGRESSRFEEFVKKEGKLQEFDKILIDISGLSQTYRDLLEIQKKHKVKIYNGELQYDYNTKVPKELISHHQEVFDVYEKYIQSINIIRSELGLESIKNICDTLLSIMYCH